MSQSTRTAAVLGVALATVPAAAASPSPQVLRLQASDEVDDGELFYEALRAGDVLAIGRSTTRRALNHTRALTRSG